MNPHPSKSPLINSVPPHHSCSWLSCIVWCTFCHFVLIFWALVTVGVISQMSHLKSTAQQGLGSVLNVLFNHHPKWMFEHKSVFPQDRSCSLSPIPLTGKHSQLEHTLILVTVASRPPGSLECTESISVTLTNAWAAAHITHLSLPASLQQWVPSSSGFWCWIYFQIEKLCSRRSMMDTCVFMAAVVWLVGFLLWFPFFLTFFWKTIVLHISRIYGSGGIQPTPMLQRTVYNKGPASSFPQFQ